jgi:ABC-2 type transport system ATP-binding protein
MTRGPAAAPPHPPGDAALTAAGLGHAYRRRTALHEVSFSVAPGERVALLGPNGGGKSTLLRLACGLLPVQRGTLRVWGRPAGAAERSEVGVVFQAPSLDPHLDVRRNLRWLARLYGVDRARAARRVDEALARAGLTERAGDLVRTLSAGLRRRVDLCRALLHEPRLLLLDEPTVGLDPGARAAFLDLLLERRSDRPLTILMSTHLVDEADRLDRVLLLHQGRLVADGAPADLRRGAGAVVVSVFDPAWTPPAGSGAWRLEGGARRLHLERGGGDARAIAADLAAAGVPFAVAPPTLADVFLQRTGDPLRAGGPDLAAVPRSEAT